MKRVPFVPMPLDMAVRLSKRFYSFGDFLSKFFPSVYLELRQIEVDIKPREYVSVALFTAFFYFCITMPLFLLIFLTKMAFQGAFIRSALIGISFSFITFFYIILYPKLILKKKVGEIDKNLAPALRHMLIQVRSGVPLFSAMSSVSNGNYGGLSDEFRKTVKEISAGWSEIDALEEMGFRNPSLYFRRIVWQLSTSMRAGADIGSTLTEIAKNLSAEQKIMIRKYGSQLNPMALIYMLTAVIMPTLGLTFLLIISSLVNMSAMPVDTMLYFVVGMLAMFQFMFIGMMKSRRPRIVAE